MGRLQCKLWIIKNTTDFPWNPYNSCIFQNLGFWLSNFDKSWITELTQMEKRKLTCRLHLRQSKSEYSQEGTGLKHNPNLLRFHFHKFYHGFSKRPSLKFIYRRCTRTRKLLYPKWNIRIRTWPSYENWDPNQVTVNFNPLFSENHQEIFWRNEHDTVKAIKESFQICVCACAKSRNKFDTDSTLDMQFSETSRQLFKVCATMTLNQLVARCRPPQRLKIAIFKMPALRY